MLAYLERGHHVGFALPGNLLDKALFNLEAALPASLGQAGSRRDRDDALEELLVAHRFTKSAEGRSNLDQRAAGYIEAAAQFGYAPCPGPKDPCAPHLFGG